MSNKEIVYNTLRGRVPTLAAVCGIMANIQKESNYNPKAKGDSGTSFGLCQWHNSRWTSLKNYCVVNGTDVNTIPAQIDFLLYEMEESYGSTYTAVMGKTDNALCAGDIAYTMCKKYEKPANAEASAQTRRTLAQQLYAEYATASTVEPGYYVIQRGDTISELAEKHNITMAEILEMNPQITNPDVIKVGDIIRIKEPTPAKNQIRDGLKQIADIVQQMLRAVEDGDVS